MKTSLIFTVLSFLPIVTLVACAADTDASDDADVADAELRTAGITAIEIGRSTGFTPPPPPGSCRAFSRYSIAFASKKMSGNACVGGRSITVDRTLSTDELARVRAAVAGVRTAPRPAACPTDMPVTSLSVNRGNAQTFYVEQRAACGGSTAAVASTLSTLIGVANDLATIGQVLTFEGELKSVMAIGGETTGRVLVGSSGTFELEGEPGSDLARQFENGRAARVTGVREDRPGVEIRTRQFIKVNEMLVCPAPGRAMNCMPPTADAACLPANRTWVSARCEGVQFLD